MEFAVTVVVTPVGALGATEAVTMKGSDAGETSEVVPLPDGVTVKVYETPFVRPETVQLCVPVGALLEFATMQVPFAAVTPAGTTAGVDCTT